MRGSHSSEDPLAQVRWIPAGENPLGIELLDCRPFAKTMRSFSQDPDIATRFLDQRQALGEEHRDASLAPETTADCALAYVHRGPTRDGPLFKAEAMEDKWDVYLYDGQLYFARSWTGDLCLRARMRFSEGKAELLAVTAREDAVGGDGRYAVAMVDFLICSYLYRRVSPHPLPTHLGRDKAQLALFSFSQHGRWGLYGSFADTTALPLIDPAARLEP
ncbi:hypothetical protein FJ251_00395 [bacterium]|nr:hypothetical protein [bacterium]